MTSPNNETDWLRTGLAKLEARKDTQTELAQQFTKDKKLRARFLTTTYRCPERNNRGESCVLAYVYNTPHGIIIQHPAYVLTPKLNEELSTKEGREKHTSDGGNRWKARAYFLRDSLTVAMNCRHLHQYPVPVQQIEKAVKAKRKNIIVEPPATPD